MKFRGTAFFTQKAFKISAKKITKKVKLAVDFDK